MERYPEKFPIGFWNYTVTGQLGAKDVKDWADLGMTFAHSPSFDPAVHDKKDMLQILDACAKYGIKVIINDSRANWDGAAEDPEGYKRRFAEAYEDFGHHSAVFSFHVGDEPIDPKGFADSAAAHRLQLEVAPELVPHVNFLPYWEGQEAKILRAHSFGSWARDFAKKSDLKILCYDCYTQMNPEESGVHQYFQNLRKFQSAAAETGTIPWTTLLSVGHFRYRVPSEDDLRWQLNTAVASGMKGILWFFIYEREPISNYRVPPIDEFGERTENFERLSRVNRHFLKQYGDFFYQAEHVATYHTGKAYGGYELFRPFDSSDEILDVTCDHDLPAVLGFFKKDGEKYLAVVNNSTTESGLFKIHVPKDLKVLERSAWDGSYRDMEKYRWDAYYGETETERIGGDWLAPGQMKLYRYG